MPCGDSDIGECARGTQTCDSGGSWGDCVGDQGPETEICDGKDNDCDNNVDESNGSGELDSSDDVGGVICPLGDDAPEDPSQSDDPPPSNDFPDENGSGGVVSGCSTSGGSGSGFGFAWLLLLGLVRLRRRRS
jgi:MYXO-CTERM domain-containing protein